MRPFRHQSGGVHDRREKRKTKYSLISLSKRPSMYALVKRESDSRGVGHTWFLYDPVYLHEPETEQEVYIYTSYIK